MGFIAKMLRRHVDYVNATNPIHMNRQHDDDNVQATMPKSKHAKTTLVRSPLQKPALGIISEEEDDNKEDECKEDDDSKDEENKKQKSKLKKRSPSPRINTQSPIPSNSQSPNPTLSKLQSPPGPIAPTGNGKNVIGGALTLQAQYQKNQMISRQFLKQQEFQRQQKLQLLAQQAKQKYLDQQNKFAQSNHANNPPNAQFWQKNPHSNQYRMPSGNGQNGVQTQDLAKKKKKRRKKRRRNNKQPQQQQQQSPMPDTNFINGLSHSIPNLNINNLIHTNPATSMSPPTVLFNPNGIVQNGIVHHQNGLHGMNGNGMQYPQFNPAQFPNINPVPHQMSPPMTSNPNQNGHHASLNPNAMNFK